MIKVIVNMPEDPTYLYEKAADLMSDILIKKLNKKEVEQVIKALEEGKLAW